MKKGGHGVSLEVAEELVQQSDCVLEGPTKGLGGSVCLMMELE